MGGFGWSWLAGGESGPSLFVFSCQQTGETCVFAHSLLHVLPLDLGLFSPTSFLCRRKTGGGGCSPWEWFHAEEKRLLPLRAETAGRWLLSPIRLGTGGRSDRSHQKPSGEVLHSQQGPGLGLELQLEQRPQIDALGWMGTWDAGSSCWFRKDE